MYTIVNPNTMWNQVPMATPVPANQIYMAPVPMQQAIQPAMQQSMQPTMQPSMQPAYNMIGGGGMQPIMNHNPHPGVPTNQQPMFYNNVMPQNWFPQPYIQGLPQHAQPQQLQPQTLSESFDTRGRALSDEVFIVDNQPTQQYSNPIQIPNNNNSIMPRRRKRIVGAREDVMNVDYNSNKEPKRGRQRHYYTGYEIPKYRSVSPRSDGMSNGSSVNLSPPQIRDNGNHHNDMNINHSEESFTQSSSASGSNKETTDVNDYSLFNVFSASLYSALNRDPPEPTPRKNKNRSGRIPVRTSSPIPEDERSAMSYSSSQRISKPKLRSKKISAMNLSNSSDFQEINEMNISCDGTGSNRREKFLQALEDERERQRSMTLPKHAPKMNCKFCKNNGESPEVYTKHRLHFKEKTVCPILRMYVCRLCNSTGDFAHTIRHCPLNSRFDKIAWKATFL